MARWLLALLFVSCAACGDTPAAGRDPGAVAVRVVGVAIDPEAESPAVILEEIDGERPLPIWIGVPEAESIAARLAAETPPRPNSHDLMHFERYVEQIHNLPGEVIAAVKQNKWLATYVPRAEDGLGWRKAGYYVLNSASGSFGDAAVCLLIMASTSIGTTPVLLGLEDELPRVREELTPLVHDPKRLGEIGLRIRRLVSSFRSPNPRWVRKEYSAIMKLVDARIRRTRVVKYLSAGFLRAFYGAASRAGAATSAGS